MITYYKVTAKINGVERTKEMVGKQNPSYEAYKNRIDNLFGVKPKDKVESVKFEVLNNNLGLNYE